MTAIEPAPICLFVFNRLDHTRRTVEHLLKNQLAANSDLYIYSDGARNPEEEKKINELRKYLHTIKGFKSVTVIERQKNWGLAKSIIDGVTSIVNKCGTVVVVEDDLVTSPYFLKFMNDGLTVYKNNPRVASIHGYVYDLENLPETFFIKGADCWGWATWKDRWDKFNPDGKFLLAEIKRKKIGREFDFDGSYPYVKMLKDQIAGKNNSWAIRWLASAYVNEMYTLYPGQSLVENIGNDNSGTHCTTTDVFDVKLRKTPIEIKEIPVEMHEESRKKFILYFKRIIQSRWKRAFNALKKRLAPTL